MAVAMIDPNQHRRGFQNATDQLGKIHGPLPRAGDGGGRAWLWVGLFAASLLLVWLVVLTFAR
jgi:hypothetical protein